MPAIDDRTTQWMPGRRKWLWLITVVAFLLLGKLSWWQWQRAAEKQQIQQRLSELQQQQMELWELPQPLTIRYDGARVTGQVRWVAPFVWLLDNQLVQGKAGYDVVIPVQSQNGSGPVVLLNLGWLAGGRSRADLPSPVIPAQFELNALLRVAPTALLLGQNVEQGSHYPQRIQAIVPAELSQLSSLSLLDAVFYQQSSDFVYHYQPITLPPERHQAYALQWALLAFAVLVVGYLLNRSQED